MQNSEIRIRRLVTSSEILDVLKKFNLSFPRSIASRVGDLHSYADKLRERAFVMTADMNGVAVGFIACYANDKASSVAFLAQIAVSESLRGPGIVFKLMRACIEECKGAAMTKLRLEVDESNVRTIQFYEAIGFSSSGSASVESRYMVLNLCKGLWAHTSPLCVS